MKVTIELDISKVDEEVITQGHRSIHFIIMDALSEFCAHRQEPYYLKYRKIYKGDKLKEKKEQIKRRVAIAEALHCSPKIWIKH